MTPCIFCGMDLDDPKHTREVCLTRQHLKAAAARDNGMGSASRHAAEDYPAFREEASDFIVGYLAKHGPTPGEVLTLRCTEAGIRPHDDRAFGAVYMTLVRRHRIVKVGMVPRTLRGHAAPGGSIWSLS